MSTDRKLTNRTALVTGASRGIGRAIALALADAGADIVVHCREQQGPAESVAAEIRASGRQAIVVQGDVARSSDCAAIVDAAREALGPLTILVNNAGITRPQPLDEITEQDWDELIATNLKSAFLLTQAVLPDMRTAGFGRIVNIASVAAHLGGIVGPHYAASKAGMLGLTHSYAALLADQGITANAISPALVETAMTDGNARATPDLIPVGRFGDVDEVADVAVLLATNGYITGQTIHVNGGWHMS